MPTLDSKSEIKHNILRFTNQINNALTQAYGNVTIYVPPINSSDEEVQRNPNMLKTLQDAVVSTFPQYPITAILFLSHYPASITPPFTIFKPVFNKFIQIS